MFQVDRHFILITGEPIKFVNEDEVPGFFVAVFEHLLEGFAVVVGAGHGAVDIRIDDNDVVAFGKFVADSLLPFDGLLGLAVTRITQILHGCFHSEILLFSTPR